MEVEQVKEYLDKYNIKTPEKLVQHISELKRNTTPNISLISELAYVLEDFYFYAAKKEGVKLNNKKAQISLLFKQFPNALEAVVRCSEYGHQKYKETDLDYLNFSRVEGGSKTYADSGLRHRLQQGNDSESGLPHAYHIAWNALAELQIWIEENEKK